MTRRAVPALAAVAAALAAASPAPAAERASLPDVEDEVMCVTCNVPLNIAESPQASRERELIRDLIAQGRTKDEIKTRLVAEYGEDVLALPDEDGVGLAAYLVPIAVVGALLAALALVLPRWRRRAEQAPSPATAGAAPATEAELARLEADLRRGA